MRIACRYARGERGGRILVPTRSLPEKFDIPRPFVRAPRDRVDPVLAVYQDTGRVSAEAAAAIGGVAERSGPPVG